MTITLHDRDNIVYIHVDDIYRAYVARTTTSMWGVWTVGTTEERWSKEIKRMVRIVSNDGFVKAYRQKHVAVKEAKALMKRLSKRWVFAAMGGLDGAIV